MDANARKIHHGYGHTLESRPFQETARSFAYQLHRHRQWYGKHGISQRTLAMLAHVSRHFVENLEVSASMQASVESLLRVAIALRHPVEDLVSPARLHALQDEIERRRSLLGGAAALAAETPAHDGTKLNLAIAYRSPYLITAVSDGKTILDLRQRRLTSQMSTAHLRALIAREARSYGVYEVTVEAGTPIAAYVYSQCVRHRILTLWAAKKYVAHCEGKCPLSNRLFFQTLLARHPEFSRYVKVLPATGRVAVSERWRTSRLIVATLALAASIATPPPPGLEPGRRNITTLPGLRP
jgi:DNA-binding XRE family transcriptional regulator